MESCSTLAIVLEVKEFGESDKIITFYSEDRGKLCGIAKGARRSLKRFVNKLELFSVLELLYTNSRSSSLVMIDQAELISSLPLLRQNYNRYVAAALIAESTLHWTREHDAEPALYELLAWSLNYLTDPRHPPSWGVILFLTRLYTLVGYDLQLDGCVQCGTLLPTLSPYHFYNSRQGFVCSACRRRLQSSVQDPAMPLATGTVKILQKAKILPLVKLNRLKFTQNAESEALILLHGYGKNLLQRDSHSWAFLAGYSKDHKG
ncbi:MAG: DNA repair protein RecO [Proteobacteria bacterium]|nr:DNA repair protein RecO [Pseudomonadota bacterium]MBU1686798.1 DNA repair protein RecO [Pseudomonadota bacterium]